MPADHRLLGVALAAVGHALALAQHGDALDDLLHHLLGKSGGARRDRLLQEGLDRVLLVVLVGDELGVERLAELRAVAVERVGFEGEFP
jgi:hypothetical protein